VLSAGFSEGNKNVEMLPSASACRSTVPLNKRHVDLDCGLRGESFGSREMVNLQDDRTALGYLPAVERPEMDFVSQIQAKISQPGYSGMS
jgi:hypothetical protein